MAGLFGGPGAPQYVGPAGTALATQRADGLFGVFPGTPDYMTPSAPGGSLPPSPVPVPVPVPPGEKQGPGIEVSIRIPGLLNVQGSLCLPPWLLESAPALVPIVLHMLRQRIEGELCREVPSEVEPDGRGVPCESPRDPEYGCSETEARVWDRE